MTDAVVPQCAGGVYSAGYDVSADGTRLLMVRSGEQHPEITVVTNWLAELRRRVDKQR